MSQLYWIGGTTSVAQVDTYTPGSVTTADVNTLTVKDENNATVATITFTVGGTATAAAVVAGLVAAWNANAITVAMATPTGTATLILTATSAGVPFYVTSSVTGTGSLTRAATTASKGPNDWNSVANWSTGAMPTGSDAVAIDARGSANDILYGLYQSGTTLASLTVMPTNPPKVGQATLALTISATNVNLPPAQGSSSAGGVTRLNLNLLAVASTVNIETTGSSADIGFEPVRITGAHASNVLIVSGNSLVGIGTNRPSDAPQFPTITVGGAGSTPIVNLGQGLVAGPTCTVISGTVYSNNRPGGNAFASLVLAGITNATPPLVDFSGNAAVATVASLTLGNGKVRVAAPSQVTWTAISQSYGSGRTLSAAYA